MPGRSRIDLVFLLILAGAFALRLQLATSQGYIHDEDHTSIPLSATISFAPGHLHLPLRGENHGAMPAYFVKASSTLFGTSQLGYRLLHLLVSLCTIALIYLMTREWFGVVAARLAAALLAFNEYYLGVSSRATAHVPTLFFVTLAIFAFSRFLRTSRAAYLYGAAASVGLAFYCKETSALLLPVFFLVLLHARNRHWLRSPHVYLACAAFALLLAPDLVWNVTATPETAQVNYYANETHAQATYASHLRRVGGLGFSWYPAMFYGRGAVQAAYHRVTGGELKDETPEYRAINPALGALLLAAVLMTTVSDATRDDLRRFLLLLFWCIFGFFSLIKKGTATGRLDPVSWMWVEITILPAVVLAGAWLARTTGTLRVAAWGAAVAVLAYGVAEPASALLHTIAGAAQELFSQASHLVQVTLMGTVDRVRAHPVRTVGIAVAVGLAVGGCVGYALGRRARDQNASCIAR